MSQPHPLQKRLIDEVIDREGGYVDHPADRGGPTRYGITQATARRHGYRGPMSQLPHHVAAEIYAGDYWHSLQLDVIVDLHEPLAESLFDYGIHSGPSSAGEDLQRVLNVLNRTEHDWDDLVVDGMVGPATLGAIEDLFGERGRRGLKVLTWGVESLRGAYLIGIAEDRESQEAFTFGWLDRVRLLGGRDAHG